MGLDLSQDYLLIDDPVTVTYYRQTSPGVFADPVSLDYVARGEITKADIDADPSLKEIHAEVFNVFRARVPAGGGAFGADLAAQIGDELTDSVPGVTWTVRLHQMRDWDSDGQFQRSRLVCERRARDYRWAVVQKRPTTAQDAGGRQSYASYATVAAVNGHLRTLDYGPRDAAGRLTAPVRFELTVEADLDWRAKDVLEVTPPGGSASKYTVTGSVPRSKFNAHQRLYLERLS